MTASIAKLLTNMMNTPFAFIRTAVVAFGTLGLGTMHVVSPATAATGTDGGLPFTEGFREATARMLQGMEDGSCYRRQGTGRLKMAFVGIPPNNVHFSDALRANINRSSKTTIERFYSWNIDLLSTETLGTIAKLSAINASDQFQLRKALSKFEQAPLVIVIQATRPAKHVAQLKLELFARADTGMQVCPKSETLFLNIKTNKVIPQDQLADEVSDEPVVERRWAFTHALRQAAPAIRGFKSLTLALDYQMSGNCRLRTRGEVAFRSNYSDVEREMLSQLGLGTGEWPTLKVRSTSGRVTEAIAAQNNADAGEATLRIQMALDRNDPELVDLSVQLNRGDQSLLTRFMRVLVKPSDLAGCQPFSTDLLSRLTQESQATSQSFTIQASQPTFRIKQDQVTIAIRPGQERYFYCWIIAPDQTAYTLLPWSKEQASKPWPANKTVQYPNDFFGEGGLASPVVYQTASKELFGCFATRERAPEKLETRWIKSHYSNGGGGGPKGVVTREGVDNLIAGMRRIPGVEENYGWIVAVE